MDGIFEVFLIGSKLFRSPQSAWLGKQAIVSLTLLLQLSKTSTAAGFEHLDPLKSANEPQVRHCGLVNVHQERRINRGYKTMGILTFESYVLRQLVALPSFSYKSLSLERLCM